MSTYTFGEKVSVVIFPDESLLNEVEPLIKEWQSEGLLSPIILITPSGVEERPGEPPKILSRVLVADSAGAIDEIKEDIFKILAEHEFSVVRLVSVRALRSNQSNIGAYNAVLGKVIKYISTALPQPSSTANELDDATRVLRMNLIVAPSELHSSNYEKAFEGPWDMHVVASPEDRSTPWTGDALVHDDDRFKKFLLMHLASTAGLWSGLDISPYELVSREKAKGSSIWLSRIFISAVLTEGLSRRIAAKAVNTIANSSSDIYESKIGVYVEGTELIQDNQVDSWVDWMVDQVFSFDNAALTFEAPEEGDAPQKERWFELTQIKHFLIFAWDKLKVIPWWMWIWIRRYIGRSLERTFQGDDGLAEIGIDKSDPMDSRDRLLAFKLLEIKDATSEAKRALVSPRQRRTSKTSPKLWGDIRRIVFGMLDGSDLTDMGLMPSEGRVQVFSKTSQVIQDPKDIFEISAEFREALKTESISWKNLDAATQILKKYDENILAKKAALTSILDELVKVEDQLVLARIEER